VSSTSNPPTLKALAWQALNAHLDSGFVIGH
jgi:hypothetical protein